MSFSKMAIATILILTTAACTHFDSKSATGSRAPSEAREAGSVGGQLTLDMLMAGEPTERAPLNFEFVPDGLRLLWAGSALHAMRSYGTLPPTNLRPQDPDLTRRLLEASGNGSTLRMSSNSGFVALEIPVDMGVQQQVSAQITDWIKAPCSESERKTLFKKALTSWEWVAWKAGRGPTEADLISQKRLEADPKCSYQPIPVTAVLQKVSFVQLAVTSDGSAIPFESFDVRLDFARPDGSTVGRWLIYSSRTGYLPTAAKTLEMIERIRSGLQSGQSLNAIVRSIPGADTRLAHVAE